MVQVQRCRGVQWWCRVSKEVVVLQVIVQRYRGSGEVHQLRSEVQQRWGRAGQNWCRGAEYLQRFSRGDCAGVAEQVHSAGEKLQRGDVQVIVQVQRW